MRRRSTVLKLVLAGGALVGIGAAATSAAAWTNTTYFSSATTSAAVSLQASLSSGSGWIAADTNASGVALNISSTLTNLQPSTTKTVVVYLRNSGGSPVTVSTVTPVKSGTLFTAPCTITATASALGTTTLAVNGTTSTTVTVTTPAMTPACWNATGTLILQFVGTAT
ncbi:MAG: hypothetical protein AAGC49_01065 [Brevundimonas sp.]